MLGEKRGDNADVAKDTRVPCPEARANIISRIMLGWVFSLVYRGWRSPLKDENLWELRDFERARHTTSQLREKWEYYQSQPLPQENKKGLGRAVLVTHWKTLVLSGILKAVDTALLLAQPVLVNRLIGFIMSSASAQNPRPVGEGIGWAFALLAAPLLKTINENQYFLTAMRIGMRVRSSLQGVVYNKSLMMSPSARASSSLGQIVNLMQLDTQRIGDFFQFFHVLWAAPAQIVVTVVLLYNYIGVSAFIGMGMTVLTLPLQGYLIGKQIKLRKAGIGITDRRVKLMNEILQGIKGVKFYAWEQPFSEAVNKERTAEVQKISKTIWIRSAFMSIMMVVPIIIGVVTFTFFVAVFDQSLDADRVFTGIVLLNQLRAPVMMLPMTFSALIDTRLGFRRIRHFLDLENADSFSSESQHSKASNGHSDSLEETTSSSSNDSQMGSIEISGGEFEWGQVAEEAPKEEKKKGLFGRNKKGKQPSENNPNETNVTDPVSSRGSALNNINLSLQPGKLVAVVGRVGAGKSSLIHAILGEMRRVRGEVSIQGSVAYVAQTAWIFNETLRNNITFGREYEPSRYRTAVKVSALDHDIKVLSAGDETAIGEKGINLSGGQKQRVSIARAVYADADVYLFDDPLSALDAHVSQEVFSKCISKKGVLKKKLRLLITNQVHLLPECDEVVFIEGGQIRSHGTYTELVEKDESFRQLLNEREQEAEESRDSATGKSKHSTSIAAASSRHDTTSKANTTVLSGTQEKDNAGKDLMQDEERKTGNVVLRAYMQYAAACGGKFVFSLVILLWCVAVAVSILTQWWLAYWSDQQDSPNARSLGFYLGIYFALAVGYALLTLFRSVWYLTLALYASKGLHDRMLKSVLRAPLTFFDTTPIGRIISRFSRDINILDELLPQYFQQMLTTVLNLVGSYIFIGVILPLFFAAAVPITIFYFILQRFFNRTSLELKRLDAISKSPIYANFSETLGGLSTLRAYGKQEQARENNLHMIDINQRAYFAYLVANRWFSLYLEIAGSFLVFATAIFAVLGRNSTNAADIGLVMTYALQVTAILGFTVRSITELEGQMNAVERANYYCNDLPQEEAAEKDPGPPENWPSTGQMQITDVRMRYREELDLVLKGVNVNIAGGEKVGVVGRTGSGKSSLMIAILRMVEVVDGQITVDGVDLRALGLNDVRKKITIIPQDPVMFSGTIRFNLDPFNQHTDAELWSALEKSNMKSFVEEFDGGLDAIVSEYGENISAGQRQVICLTRALLRNSKILILDEASSALDTESDRMMQQTIRTYLKDATILTIAHRLFTLADYDKIIVMDDGIVAEYGSPADLLNNGGHFAKLVKSMGAAGESQFRKQVMEGGFSNSE